MCSDKGGECTGWSWGPADGGTCKLKNGAVADYLAAASLVTLKDSGIVSGYLNPSGEQAILATEDSAAYASCPSNHVISEVVGAWYAALSGSIDVKSIITSRCIGKPSCTVRASNDVFGEPQAGELKALLIYFKCVASNDKRFDSPQMYGASVEWCLGWGSTFNPNECGLIVADRTWKPDNGGSCTLKNAASSAVFDASINTVRDSGYVSGYNTGSGFPGVLATEGSTAYASCAAGKTLGGLVFWQYGGPTQNADSNTVSSAINGLCKDKSSCTVQAGADLFGDPEPGALKALIFYYYCA
ncbi:rhamnose-binding lectin-like [Micractinium conductrix]|uniref:Rhamnose-binding lectin-like n=1 Tax=Micractinium conductrix TaxID=554055 RepID=A0A2P6VGK4_9CHLO|nr:rhamnose-binding lectin-like [Micractinium conductrix]|eukprot:PSC73226.1 rhamnose-binding lectin-like [Micractinium conductrix]